MKKFNYRLAQKRVKLAILIAKFSQVTLELLSVIFNYQQFNYNDNA